LICPACGHSSPEEAQFCAACGYSFAAKEAPASALATVPAPPVPAPAAYAEAAAAVEPPMRYAGFWRRFLALILDMLVYLLAIFVVSFFVGLVVVLGVGPQLLSSLQTRAEELQVPLALLHVFCLWLYYALTESSPWQATPGKRALGLLVVDARGNRLSFWGATRRHLAKFVAGTFWTAGLGLTGAGNTLLQALGWASLLFGVSGFLLAGFTRKKQALHDLFVDCLVLRKS